MLAILFGSMACLVIVFGVMISRFYVKPPPGKALIVTGLGGMKATTGAGIMVYPMIHQYHFLDLEVRTIDFANEQLVVQVTHDRDNILTAAVAFGAKTPEETRDVLQVLADSAREDHELLAAKLAEVGYRIL